MYELRLLKGGGMNTISGAPLIFLPRTFTAEGRLGRYAILHGGGVGPMDVLLLGASPYMGTLTLI